MEARFACRVHSPRNSICVISDRGTNEEVRLACKEFVAWAKAEYRFPLPLRIYLRDQAKLRAMDGGFTTGTFFEPSCYGRSSYIRIAVGDYGELASEIGRDDALATILTFANIIVEGRAAPWKRAYAPC